MKTATQRCYEMLAQGTSGANIVKRLSAEFAESFWQQGEKIMEEYRGVKGTLERRCIAYVYG